MKDKCKVYKSCGGKGRPECNPSCACYKENLHTNGSLEISGNSGIIFNFAKFEGLSGTLIVKKSGEMLYGKTIPDINKSIQLKADESKHRFIITNGEQALKPYLTLKPNGTFVWFDENPETEVIIKRSGKTWVAKDFGKDRICICPTEWTIQDIEELQDGRSSLKNHLEDWPLTTEVEITDEIALLRPMVIPYDSKEGEHDYLDMLIAYIPEAKHSVRCVNVSGSKNCRIATVDDLEG